MYPQYMCILLYVKLIWCNGIPLIYFQLEWVYMYPQYMYILLYVKFIWCNSIPTISCHLGGIDVCLVYVHSVICESYVVWCYSRYLLSIGLGRSMYPQYMCILLYVTLSFGVMVFQISIVNWSVGYMYPQYMCILLYVKLILCNGIPLIYCQLGG